MIKLADINSVVELYEKHGWTLRRVLLTEPLHDEISEDVFAKAVIEDSEIDALWFSRTSKPESETWELRRLTGSPFALIAVFDKGETDAEREETLREIEERMENADIEPTGH